MTARVAEVRVSAFDRAECERLIARCHSDNIDDDDANVDLLPMLESALSEIDRLQPVFAAAESMLPDWDDTSGSMSRIDAMTGHCRAIADAVRKANGVDDMTRRIETIEQNIDEENP